MRGTRRSRGCTSCCTGREASEAVGGGRSGSGVVDLGRSGAGWCGAADWVGGIWRIVDLTGEGSDGTIELMRSSETRDTWADGEAYEPYVGRWSRLVAREFLGWLGVPAGREWLDVGCGTGALTQTILATCAPRSVLGVDASAGYVAYAREQVTDGR